MSNSEKYRGEPDSLIDKIRELEKRISILERTPRANNTTISGGELTVQGGAIVVRRPDDLTGNEGIISLGSNDSVNGEQGMSISVQRSQTVPGAYRYGDGTGSIVSGNTAMRVATVDGTPVDPTFAFPTIELFDKSGDAIFSDSTNARRGMREPVLHYAFTDGTYFSSTSGTFAFIMSCEWYMYHAHFRCRVLIQNDVGSTSEVRISEVGGNSNISTVAFGSGAFQYYDFVVPRSERINGNNPNGNIAIMNLEHRRTGGAGTVRTQIISCVGIDLSWFHSY